MPVTTRNDGRTSHIFARPQTGKLEFDEQCVRDGLKQQNPHEYAYEPKAGTIIATDVGEPRTATLPHSGDELKSGHRDRTLMIAVPAEQTAKLADAARVSW